METIKISIEELYKMSERKINEVVFEDAEPYEPRGLLSILGEENVIALLDHPEYKEFSESFKDWIWSCCGALIDENL